MISRNRGHYKAININYEALVPSISLIHSVRISFCSLTSTDWNVQQAWTVWGANGIPSAAEVK